MIKYEIKLGAKELNEEARRQRDRTKIELRGMHCRKCGIDTIFEFKLDEYGFVAFDIKACCKEFETRIRKKILPNSLKL